jgi:hypothetical protein
LVAKPQLIDILAQNESISASDLDRAVRLQQERNVPLAEVLVWENLLQEDDLFFMLQRALGMAAIPEERLLHLTLTPEVRRRVPRSFARAQVLIPLDLDTGKGLLLCAMFDPSDRGVLEKLRATARVAEIRPYLARRSSILNALKTVYSDADEFRDGDPDWLPVGKTAERAAAAVPESKVEIDPGLVEELALVGSKTAEPLRSIRVQRPLVLRADAAPPAVIAVEPPPPGEQRRAPAPAAAAPVPERRPRPAPARPLPPPEPAPPAPAPKTPEPEPDSEDEVENQDTGVFKVENLEKPSEETVEVDIPAELVFDHDAVPNRNDFTPPLAPMTTTETMRLPAIEEMEQADSLLRELLSSVGVLISMLEERVDPDGGSCREYGRVTRAVARELGLDEISVARVALAAQLFALDLALRRELGIRSRVDVTAAFAAQPSAPGGLGPSLRSLGAKALGLEDGPGTPTEAALIRVVADYLELRAESEENVPDLETVGQLLRTGGADAQMVDALVRALELDAAHGRMGPASG